MAFLISAALTGLLISPIFVLAGWAKIGGQAVSKPLRARFNVHNTQ